MTRDDLQDGGAAHFAGCVHFIREAAPQTTVEVLVPDFSGSEGAIRTVVDSMPDVINHNIETIPRLYPSVRPGASYRRSLGLLRTASRAGAITKSGLMLGLGENRTEVTAVLRDLLDHECDMLTIGQYLPPTANHFPLDRFVTPEEFSSYRTEALDMGFRAVASAPLVRSSYEAAALYRETVSWKS